MKDELYVLENSEKRQTFVYYVSAEKERGRRKIERNKNGEKREQTWHVGRTVQQN